MHDKQNTQGYLSTMSTCHCIADTHALELRSARSKTKSSHSKTPMQCEEEGTCGRQRELYLDQQSTAHQSSASRRAAPPSTRPQKRSRLISLSTTKSARHCSAAQSRCEREHARAVGGAEGRTGCSAEAATPRMRGAARVAQAAAALAAVALAPAARPRIYVLFCYGRTDTTRAIGG